MRAFEQYIDTDIHGLIVTVPHNLKAFPTVSFLRVETGPPKQTLISLFDPIITEVEALNSNEVKVTFSGVFTGYVRAITGDSQDFDKRIDTIEEDINFIYTRLDTYATSSQLTQLSSLRDQQHKELQDQVDDLNTQLESLTNRVDNL
jgi:hypothetical protein